MAVLTIALLGASHTGVLSLADAVNGALKTSGWQAVLEVVSDKPTRQADLADFDLVLLVGLESTAESRIEALEAADLSIRATLALAAVPYRVLYGTCEERLAHVWHAIESLLPRVEARPRQSTFSDGIKKQPWVWMCEKCSDPQCEHRLLTALLARRADTL